MSDVLKKPAQPAGNPVPVAICVWGPAGSPGKSTVAANLACEMSLAGRNVLLIDLDTVAPGLGDLFGIDDSPPGLAAAARLVGQGRLDLEQIERLAARFSLGPGNLSILTGLGSTSRWAELTSERIEGLITAGLKYFDFVLLDVASSTEPSIRQIGGAVDRNCATRTALMTADLTIAVVAGDPIGLKRFMQAVEGLKELSAEPILVVNRVRQAVLGSRYKKQLADVASEFLGLKIAVQIPNDPETCDKSILEQVPLALMKRSSPARQAIAKFAKSTFLSAPTFNRAPITKLD